MATKEQSLSKIRQIARLKDNWNGYRAKGGRSYPISRANSIVEILSMFEEEYGDDMYPEVYPTARESIQFEWEVGLNHFEFEIRHDTVSVLCVMNREYHNAFSQEYDYDKLSEPLRSLEKYLADTRNV